MYVIKIPKPADERNVGHAGYAWSTAVVGCAPGAPTSSKCLGRIDILDELSSQRLFLPHAVEDANGPGKGLKSEPLDKADSLGYSSSRMANTDRTEELPGESAIGHQRPSVTVDVVATAHLQRRQMVLLVRRKKPPFKESWAIPGGFVNPHEPLAAAARRELWEETRIAPPCIEQLRTFGTPGRDPRGWTISVVYAAVLGKDEAAALHPLAGSDATEVRWFDLDNLPALAFDHLDIIAYAISEIEPLPS